MTTSNQPGSGINPTNQPDLNQENREAFKNDQTLKNSPPTSGSAREDLNLPNKESHRVPDMNEAGDHPVATSAGTLGGAAAGAAIGSVGGPAGAVVGGLVGGVIGGLAGNEMAEASEPTIDTPEGVALSGSEKLQDNDDDYWRERYTQTPYYNETRSIHGDLDYDRDYRGAYRLGYENRANYNNVDFDQAEPDLHTKWEQAKGESRLTWEHAKQAVKDAWNRTTDSSEGAALSGSERLRDNDDNYWRERYTQTPYYNETRSIHGDLDYDRDYRGAYRLGYENRANYNNVDFDQAEPDLRTKWEQAKGESRLNWEQAKQAVKDAWNRATH